MTDFDLEKFFPYLLNQAAEASSLAFQQVYKDRYGMLRNEWRVLFHLGILHKTKISRAVSKLEARRFLTREKDQHDRRVEHLRLTKAGKAAYTELRDVAQSYDAALLAELSAYDADQLKTMLIKLAGRQIP